MCSKWISLNVLMLDEKRVIVEEDQTSLIAAFKDWGFEPIKCPFINFAPFGGLSTAPLWIFVGVVLCSPTVRPMQSSAQKYRLDWKLQILKGLLNRSQPIELLSPEALRQRNETSRPAVIDWLKHGRKRKLPKVCNQWVTGRHGNIPIRLYYPSLNSLSPALFSFMVGVG